MDKAHGPMSNIFKKARLPRVLRSDLKNLVEMLERPDYSMSKIGAEVSSHPAIVQEILRAANSSLTGAAGQITDPAHAILFLGSRRVIFLLNTLPEDLIEAEVSDQSQAG